MSSRSPRLFHGLARQVEMLLLSLALTCWCAAASSAQQGVDDVFGNFGTGTAISNPDGHSSSPSTTDAGQIGGRVFDAETGQPVAGATVILIWPQQGAQAQRQQVAATAGSGDFEFSEVPEGRYELHFVKSGYRMSTMTGFEVVAGTLNRADFPMPPVAAGAASDVLDLDAFVVDAEVARDMVGGLELRLDSDQMLNVMSAEDLSRYAASDVADALKRVAGVNIVEGQFAIIRGLEDRYSSTLYNGAPLPSPDPESQSVQLDLFPSDVVSNLSVAKTFGAEMPGNSGAGSIDILTLEYPETLEVKVWGGGGFESNARAEFLEYNSGSPAGNEIPAKDVIESDWGGSMGGRKEFFDREIRFKAVGGREIDFRTAQGYQQDLEPNRFRLLPTNPVPGLTRNQSGGLSLGELDLTDARYDYTASERTDQSTGYVGLGVDLDEAGLHRLDGSFFYTRKKERAVGQQENGYFPGFDYGALAIKEQGGDPITTNDFSRVATLGSWIANGVAFDGFESVLRGHQWYSSFGETRSVERNRDLLVGQLNGDHEFSFLEGLQASWAWNHAETKQQEEASRARYFFDPADRNQPRPTRFPVQVSDLGPGSFVIRDDLTINSSDVDEKQNFARIDGEYSRELSDSVDFEVGTGGWFEQAKRSADARFLEFPFIDPATCFGILECQANRSQFAILGDTLEQAGSRVDSLLTRDAQGNFAGDRASTSDTERTVWAWNLHMKTTLWEDVDVLAGVRGEYVDIRSQNDAFGDNVVRFGVPDSFPTRYLFFDRLDNPNAPRREVGVRPPPNTIFNDQLLGVEVPIDPATGIVDLSQQQVEELLNGRIDEALYLPTVGLAYRPLDGLNLRTAWSRTAARPSFRELSYFVTVPAASNDLEVGNPQLQLSRVESADARLEYTWGGFGELFAVSGFWKKIDDPIEKIVIRDPVNFDDTSRAVFRTWFNNPNTAKLWGIEVEGRKNLGFLGFGKTDFLEYFSIGGNFTWIDAEVGRTDAELSRSTGFFGVIPGDSERFSELAPTRRLFGQPEWIANADLSFDHEGWGTKLTLAYFGISDVLDAAGSASIAPNSSVVAFTIDRYVDSFHQLDLVFSQRIWRGLSFKMSVKNLTDSKRGIVYDPSQTNGEIAERVFRIGRDYSFSLSYTQQF